MITAPFNFVPLSDKVFLPEWSEWVSHDIPFSDGESGEIEINIEALSPIFVRDHDDETRFCNYKGQYFIPGSSIKGVIRNVLEILSFSKIAFVDDKTYAVRDLQNAELYREKFKADNIYAGWLRKDEKYDYVIDDCGHPGRISHKDIDEILGAIGFDREFSDEDKFDGTEKKKTAWHKYDLAKDNLTHMFRYRKKNSQGQEVYGPIESRGEGKVKRGTLVFTGQPTKRENTGKQGDGKGFEFVFFDVVDVHRISEEQFEKFKFAYFDGRKKQPKESADWTRWKEVLQKGGRVPVFFRKNDQGEVEDFGLSMLYKLPYKHSILDGLPPAHISLAPIADLTETILGYVDEMGEDALKGRVHFSHAKAERGAQEDRERTLILGTPRPSYYPIYVEQKEGKRYKTYMNKDFKIRGWKRYPVHKGSPAIQNAHRSNVTSTFVPLKKGVRFVAKIKYHNLRSAEIGALLSALTFHGCDNCFHTIGLAKAYGFGKSKVTITGGRSDKISNGKKVDWSKREHIEQYLGIFECMMEKVESNWPTSKQLRELFAMAQKQNNQKGKSSELKYMTLKEYSRNKATGYDPIKIGQYLDFYSSLRGVDVKFPDSQVDKIDCQSIRENYGSFAQTKIWELDEEYAKKHKNKYPRLLDLLLKKHTTRKKEIYELMRDIDKENWQYEDKETLLFHSAISSENLHELDNFLKNHPNTQWKDEIEKAILSIQEKERIKKERLEREAEWERLKDTKDTESLKSFIDRHPDSPESESAQKRLDAVEKEREKERQRKLKAEEAKRKAQAKGRGFAKGLEAIKKKGKHRKKH